MPDLWDDGWSEGQKWERARIITIIKEEAGAAPAGWTYSDWLVSLIEDDTPKALEFRKVILRDGVHVKKVEAKEMPCLYCDTGVDAEVWAEELQMCVECSNKFYAHEINPYDDSTWPKNKERGNEL